MLQSTEPVTLGRWHRVMAERVHKDGTLVVDDAAPVKRSSPGKSQGLNLRSPLYLGGTEPPLRPPTNASFRGCIGEVRHPSPSPPGHLGPLGRGQGPGVDPPPAGVPPGLHQWEEGGFVLQLPAEPGCGAVQAELTLPARCLPAWGPLPAPACRLLCLPLPLPAWLQR